MPPDSFLLLYGLPEYLDRGVHKFCVSYRPRWLHSLRPHRSLRRASKSPIDSKALWQVHAAEI